MALVKKLSAFCLLLVALSFPSYSQNDFCGQKNTSFQEGEHLKFKVYYNMSRIWINAGEANFNVDLEQLNGHSVYHITGDGKTSKSYEWVYKVHDVYETYIDVATMLPIKFVRNVNEGGFKIYNNISFNQSVGQAVSTKGVFDVPKCIQDVLSAIYYARNIDYDKYQAGAKIPFTMFLDDNVYSLYVRYIGKEQIKTRYGTFNTIKISPLLIEGTIFKGGEKMTVWISDDANHVPVRVDSPILVGSIKVDLFEYDKLRNPFNGLVGKK
ncbi:MAG: DUF3108 domain-containing protein [Bacteroidota bacterium]